MAGRQKARSEETKQAILAAAGQLFAERGFEAVTMREIAREAGCSHTAIYIYFEDKESLLHHLAVGPLESLRQQMESALGDPALSPDGRMRLVSRVFVRFCLAHRTMYSVLFMARASRVDLPDQALEVQNLRNLLFGLLRQAVRGALPSAQSEEQVLAYARIHFFALHGMISLYAGSDEPLDQLMERLSTTFDLAVDVVLAGLKQSAERGAQP